MGVGDGKLSTFRGFEYSYSTLKVFDDQNMMPLETWHPRIDNVVYWGMDWLCPAFDLVLSNQIKKFYGKLTPQVGIQYLTAVEESGLSTIKNNFFIFFKFFFFLKEATM